MAISMYTTNHELRQKARKKKKIIRTWGKKKSCVYILVLGNTNIWDDFFVITVIFGSYWFLDAPKDCLLDFKRNLEPWLCTSFYVREPKETAHAMDYRTVFWPTLSVHNVFWILSAKHNPFSRGSVIPSCPKRRLFFVSGDILEK